MVQGAERCLAGRRRPEVVDEDGLEAVLDGEADALHVVDVVHVVAALGEGDGHVLGLDALREAHGYAHTWMGSLRPLDCSPKNNVICGVAAS